MIGGPVRGTNPPTRLAYLARMVLTQKLTIDAELDGGRRPYPFTPDIADFADAFILQMEWELNKVRIEEHGFFGNARLEQLQKRQAEIEKEMNKP